MARPMMSGGFESFSRKQVRVDHPDSVVERIAEVVTAEDL
jgi:hypothetical protein